MSNGRKQVKSAGNTWRYGFRSKAPEKATDRALANPVPTHTTAASLTGAKAPSKSRELSDAVSSAYTLGTAAASARPTAASSIEGCFAPSANNCPANVPTDTSRLHPRISASADDCGSRVSTRIVAEHSHASLGGRELCGGATGLGFSGHGKPGSDRGGSVATGTHATADSCDTNASRGSSALSSFVSPSFVSSLF